MTIQLRQRASEVGHGTEIHFIRTISVHVPPGDRNLEPSHTAHAGPRHRGFGPCENKAGAGSVAPAAAPAPPLPPPPQQQQLLPAPATAGAPAPAPRSTGSAQPPFSSSPPAAGRGWSMGGAAAAEPTLLNWSSSWPVMIVLVLRKCKWNILF
jgi:hypothetical protein